MGLFFPLENETAASFDPSRLLELSRGKESEQHRGPHMLVSFTLTAAWLGECLRFIGEKMKVRRVRAICSVPAGWQIIKVA